MRIYLLCLFVALLHLILPQRSQAQKWVTLGNDFDNSIAFMTRGVDLSADGSKAAVGYSDGVRCYEWNVNGWTQFGNPVGSSSSIISNTYCIALNDAGDRIAIGAPSSNGEKGAVEVYEWDGQAWTQMGSTFIGSVQFALMGVSVDMNNSGDILVLSEPTYSGTMSNNGRVLVYEWMAALGFKRAQLLKEK